MERSSAGAPATGRIAGINRYDTAARLALRFIPQGSTREACVVNGDNLPDALAAGAASSYTGGPVLLTQTRVLPSATSNGMRSLGVAAVTVVGGDSAVSAAVAARIRGVAGSVERVAGVNRYDTAKRLATTIPDAGSHVLLATGVPTHTTSYLNRRLPASITGQRHQPPDRNPTRHQPPQVSRHLVVATVGSLGSPGVVVNLRRRP